MTVQFRPAARENVPVIVGLSGGTGSGKTFSGLLIADGIAGVMRERLGRPIKIFGLDTERGRMLRYADQFEFMHGELGPPFRPMAYQDAIEAAEKGGADICMIDSFSHEWAGEGGCLEWADELEEKGLKPPLQWKDPKRAHKRLVNFMLSARPHIILCLRAEEKLRIEMVPMLDDRGQPIMRKGEPAKKMVIAATDKLPPGERWQPICEKNFPFEITTSVLLTRDAPGMPIHLRVEDADKPAFPIDRPITRETGAYLARWSLGDAKPAFGGGDQGGESLSPPPPPRGAMGDPLDDARAMLRDAADMGTDELRRVWNGKFMTPFREALEGELESFKARAAKHESAGGLFNE